MHTFLMIVQVFCSLAIVALVLLQRGKGADAGAGFGAGASGTVFGARGARTALSRATAVLAAVFMLNSLALAYMGARQEQAPPSRLDRLSEPQGAAQTPSAAPAATTGDGAAPAAGKTEQGRAPVPPSE